ncbi:MAG: membrane protein insertion efficiency factor YidD [Ignavibacteriaceae bacterium]|nr:membrane protein insertion efficiency factor YidD [Ignavibacteriaceae bacterium]
MIKLFVLICLGMQVLFAQTDWEKWGKADIPYTINSGTVSRNYSIGSDNPGQIILKSLVIGYWVIISDVDGDNCPFSPTCSSFFLQSVKETNIVQGTLMFADRFTRDMNTFGRLSHYPISRNRHLYDPPTLYTLDKDKIKYIPAGVIVNE